MNLTSRAFSRPLGSALLSIPMVLAASAIAVAQDLSFWLSNETDTTLLELYIVPTNVGDWEENILDGYFFPGDRGEIVIADGLSTCVYDILGVFDDGEELEDYEIDLCELKAYSFVE